MRTLILFCLFLSPFYLSAENIQGEQPSLMEALQMFCDQSAEAAGDVHAEQDDSVAQVEDALKGLLQEIKGDGEGLKSEGSFSQIYQLN